LPASIGKALGARGPRFAQADFSALPFEAGAFEFVWSNLALHWHSQPDLVFPEWQRVLKVGGLLMFSTLGPDTLKELRGAYAEVEAAHGVPSRKHVIDFVDMHDLGDMLVESGFEIPVMDQETLTITYRSPQSLLADVRRWGAYPFEREGASSAAARRLYKALLAAMEARRRADGTLALTFEVIYGHAWKAVPRMTAEGHGIVRLEDIGRGPSGNR
jgi:malonyl-CoA O-methyltransferase